MSPDGEQPDHRALLHRLQSSYVSSSLTILSIIQGVALAALGAVVAANWLRMTPAQWVMVVVTFGTLIVVWTQVSIETMTWVMVPDAQLILIPFSAGALELLLVGTTIVNLALWLFAGAVLIAFSSIGLMQVERRASQEPQNVPLFARLRGMRRSAHIYNLAGVLLYLLLGVATLVAGSANVQATVGRLAAADTVAVTLAGLWMVGWLLRSFAYWRKIVAFARTGR